MLKAVQDPRDVVLMCPIDSYLLAALDEQADREGLDRPAMLERLLTEALSVRALGEAVETAACGGLIPFPAVRVDDEPV